DREALDDYLRFIDTVKPEARATEAERLSWVTSPFEPMARFPRQSGSAEVVGWLLRDKPAPWVALLRLDDPHEAGTSAPGRPGPGRASGLRKAVLRELGNKDVIGSIASAKGHGEVPMVTLDLSGEHFICPDLMSPDFPEPGIKETFRVCDHVAHQIGLHF